MLLDLNFVLDNYQLVIFSVVLVILVKTIIAGGTGFILGHTFRGTVMVGLALSQVGEFSFILAKIGQSNAVISDYYYQLFLAVAVITMALTPFLMRYSMSLANLLMKLPLPKLLVNGMFPLKEVDIPNIKNHLVIIGTDKSALILSLMAKLNNMQQVSIVFDPIVAKEKLRSGDLTVYGDAVNEPILLKAHVETAEIVIVSVSNLIPTMGIVEKVRHLNANAYIIVRAKNIDNLEPLYKMGADQILPEKLEIAIDLFNRVLVKKSYPQKEVSRILTHIRNLNLGKFSEKDIINPPTVFYELRNMSISAIKVEPDSQADGKSLIETHLRSKTGVTLVAIKKDTTIIEHPEPHVLFEANDIVYVLGKPEQVNLAYDLFSNPS